MGTRYYNMELPVDLHRDLKVIAAENGTTLKMLIIAILAGWVGEREYQGADHE